ncbi:MAG: flagellar biosynthetic protein FliR, partial [Gammaproteobacteria bacterium]|nr:flagellar biosynthetic protein FliR [Gammaproteobacteria bacterium]
QNGVNVPVLSQFFVIVATLIFLSLNGHLAVIALLVKSFELMPIKGVGLTREAYWTVASWASEMLIGAVRIALPVVVSILIAYLALGVMTRAAPQLNVFSVGFPVILLFGFVLLALTMPSFLPAFAELFDGGIELIDTLFSVSR